MWISIKSALISGVIAAFLAVAGYIIGVGDVFKLDPHALINTAVMATLVALVSLIKSGLTSNSGDVAGVQIRPDNSPTI